MAEDAIHFSCAVCRAEVRVAASMSGRTGTCPRCGDQIRIPSGESASVDPPPPAAHAVLAQAVAESLRKTADDTPEALAALTGRPDHDSGTAPAVTLPMASAPVNIPPYKALEWLGKLLFVGGIGSVVVAVVLLGVAVAAYMENSWLGFTGVVQAMGSLIGAVVLCGVGSALKALRDIARNSWRTAAATERAAE